MAWAPSGKQNTLLVTSRSKYNPTGILFGNSKTQHRQDVKLLKEGTCHLYERSNKTISCFCTSKRKHWPGLQMKALTSKLVTGFCYLPPNLTSFWKYLTQLKQVMTSRHRRLPSKGAVATCCTPNACTEAYAEQCIRTFKPHKPCIVPIEEALCQK